MEAAGLALEPVLVVVGWPVAADPAVLVAAELVAAETADDTVDRGG